MILCSFSRQRCDTVYLEGERKDFTLLEEKAYLIQQKGSWSLRLPYMLKRTKEPADSVHLMHVTHRKSGVRADLYFIPCDEGYKRFDKFSMPLRPFTLGSSNDDDLSFNCEFLPAHAFTIDPCEHAVYANQDVPVTLNGRIIGSESSYLSGDEFSCYGLRIVFHDKFLMINRMNRLSHRLKPFDPCSIETAANRRKRILHYQSVPFEMPAVSQSLRLEEAPLMNENQTRSLFFTIGPSLLMSAASLSSGLLSVYLGYQNGREIIEMVPMIVLPSVMMLSTLLWTPLQSASDTRRVRREKSDRRKEYDGYLNRTMDEIDAFREEYLNVCERLFPDTAAASKRYEKEDTLPILDEEHLLVRLGTCKNILHTELTNISNKTETDVEILRMKNLFFKEALRQVRVPFLVSLNTYHKIVIDEKIRYLAADIMMQIALRTHPDEVGIAIICSLRLADENRWMLDIPHLYNDQDVRLLADEPHEIKEVLSLCRSDSRKIIMFNLNGEDLDLTAYETEICCAADASEMRADLRISKEEGWIAEDFINHSRTELRLDEFDPGIIRYASMLPHRTAATQIAGAFSFLEMHGCKNEKELLIEQRWSNNDINTSICSLIGCSGDGRDINLDLYEKRDGPHGLIAGTTGSGKSELILTMILSLAINYAPRDLQFILIDFKGGSSLNSLTNENNPLPHVTGTLSNLDEDDMARVLVQFSIECKKREALLRQMSMDTGLPVMNVSDYRRLYRKDCGLEYICELVIIVDEFAELKKEQPEFLNELISIARIGRSLGIHLILSTQKPSGVVTDQIWSNSKFKICLKVSEKQDSMEMIHCPDAAGIREAGCFYLLAEERIQYGRSGYVQSRQQLADSCTVVYDTSHRIVASSASLLEKVEPEINRVIAEINRVYRTQDKVKPLWNAPLNSISKEDVTDRWAYGLIDDYRHNATLPLTLIKEEVCAFVTIDQSERKNLSRVLVQCILENCDNNDDLIIVDDLHAFDREACMKSKRISDVISSTEDEKCASMYDLLASRENAKNQLFVLFDDLSAHYDADENYRAFLMKYAPLCESLHLTLILMSQSASTFSYRETALLKRKAVLKGASSQDIQSFLETGSKITVSKKCHGIFMDAQLMDFCVYECNPELFASWIEETASKEAERSRTILPCMPEVIDTALCEGEGIPFAIRKRDYTWLTLNGERKLCIVYADEEDCLGLTEVLEEHGVKIQYQKSGDARVTCIPVNQANDFDSYANRNHYTLFVGDAFSMQYRVHARIVKKENESVLYFKNKAEVVRCAEK